MAAKAIKYPLTRASKRGYVTQAAVKAVETSSPNEIQNTVLPNKMVVNSLDRNGPLSRVSVVFRVGPRHEKPEISGINHIIKAMTGFSTEKCSGFAIVRNLQKNGIHFTCSGDREITAYNVVATRNKINEAFKYLAATICTPAFKPWQVKDNYPTIKYQIACVTPKARTMDILHKAAYRTGLGNSLILKKDFVGMHSSEKLLSYYKEHFTANRAAIVGLDVSHHDLVNFAKSLDLAQNDSIDEGNSTYYGGEIRKDKNSYYSHVAIAAEGIGMKDMKEALAYSILQHAYGVRPTIAWGNSPTPLQKAVTSAASDAGVSCFNICYSDSGLFGFLITSSGCTIGPAVEQAFKVLKSASLTSADVKRGKALLKMNILSGSEESEVLAEDMIGQTMNGGIVIPPSVVVEAVENVSESDVMNAAKKIAKGKFSLAGFGDLRFVPYLDQFK